MYQITLMTGSKFTITEEEYNLLREKSGLISLPIARRIINTASISEIIPIDLINETRKINRDGQWCIKKFGEWYLENTTKKIDLFYYPELNKSSITDNKQLNRPEEPSKYGKELAEKL